MMLPTQKGYHQTKNISTCFMNHTRDFDNVHHDFLLPLLRVVGEDIPLNQYLYWNQ